MLLLVEDLHDADEGLLDFLEHLVDWVRELPVLVIGFARPGAASTRRPAPGDRPEPVPRQPGLRWAAGAMRELLAGLVDRIPPEAAAAIEAQAQGIPLFAVETVRSLIDQQVVVATGNGYALSGRRGHARRSPRACTPLLAARLDALDTRGPVAGRRRRRDRGAVHGRDPGRGLGSERRPGAGRTGRARPPRRAPDQRRHAVPADRLPTATPTGCWPRSPTRPCRTGTSRSATSGSPGTSPSSTRNEGDALAEVDRTAPPRGAARPGRNDVDVDSPARRRRSSGWCGPASARGRPAPRPRPPGCSPRRPS